MNNFRVLKVPFKSVIRDPDKTIPPLLDYIQNMNIIVSLAYSLIRLYILHCFHNKVQLPNLSKEFCGNALSVIMFPKRKRSKQSIAQLQVFYKQQFVPLLPTELTFESKNLSSIAQSLSEEMATALHNNITVHFVSRLKTQIIQLIVQQKEFSKLTKPQVRQGASKVINALWERNINDLPSSLHDIYQQVLFSYLPQRIPEKNLGWDLEANFLDYLQPTLLLNQQRETHGRRLFQPVSLRNSMVPKYMPIDTNALIRLFDFTNVTHYSNSELLLNYKESEELQYVIWNRYFKLDKRIFRDQGDYVFAHSITTDGIGLSIRFIHKDHVERFQRRYQKKTKNQKKLKKTTKKQRKCQQKQADLELCPLVTELSNTKKSQFRKRSLVGLDPGLGNLVYLIDDNDQRLRYTSQQRYKESYSRQNRTVRQRMQKKAGTQQIEKVLNDYNSKTMDYDKFKEFLGAKFQVMVRVHDHYRQLVYRKLNLRKFIYGKRSEAKLLNAIESKFGADCVIGYGNWSRRSAMPGTAPVPGVSLKRKIATRFTTVSIDEYKTSSICSSCQVGSLENVYHKKRGENSRNKKIHRLLMCRGCCSLQNGNKVRYLNRDVVGSKNILSVLECELSNKERPPALKRNGINVVQKVDPFSAVSVCLPKLTTIIKKRISLVVAGDIRQSQ